MSFGNEKCKEIVENICPYCKEHLIMNKRSFANHVRWCKKNPKYEQLLISTKEKISEKIKQSNINKNGEIKEFTVKCYNCGKEFIVKEREFKFPQKEHYYCSSECNHAHNKFIENIGQKISDGFKNKSEKYKKYYKERYGHEYNEYNENNIRICPICGKEFRGYSDYCSQKCARKYSLYERIPQILKLQDDKKIEEIKKIYKRYCQFTFNLKEFPNEYDFDLIKKYGWYKAKNKGNNLNGVSRDHKYSCNEAFKNLIDPYIISHPANCQLLRHNENVSKLDNCSISLNELKNNIKEWNVKYGEYPNKIDYSLFEKLNIKFNWDEI